MAELLTNRKFWLGLAAYLVPTFALGFAWHLAIFAPLYQSLQIYRPDVIIPLGLLSMLIQGSILSWLYPRVMRTDASWMREGLKFAVLVGLFAWSFSTNVMTSVPLYLALETAFTAVQYAIVCPLIALAHRR